MIVLCIQGSGKTYLSSKRTDVIDIDVKEWDRTNPDWINDYINTLCEKSNDSNYVLGNISYDIMKALASKDVHFSVITPIHNMSDFNNDYQTIKEILFGRYVLRKEQNARTIKWLEKTKRHFDEYTDYSLFKEFVDKGILDHIYELTPAKTSVESLL